MKNLRKMSLSFLFVIYFLMTLYNRSCLPFFATAAICEIIGRSTLFSWALYYDYGSVMYLVWALVYCLTLLTCYRFVKLNITTIVACGIMILFQCLMSVDSANSQGFSTILYNLYYVINVVIHCCIVLTFISWRNIKRTMGDFIDILWLVMCRDGAIMDFRTIN